MQPLFKKKAYKVTKGDEGGGGLASGVSGCSPLKMVVWFLSPWQIYDVATGTRLMTLFDDDKANNYKANMATFSPTDDLVLNDGVLWDVRCCKPLHKFDKFNQYISGVFHPHGLEIIINSEVVSFEGGELGLRALGTMAASG